MIDMAVIPDAIPQEIMDYAKLKAVPHVSFASFIEQVEGVGRKEILQRVFAFRMKKQKGKEQLLITEVIRRQTGKDYEIFRNMYYSSMGGWVAVYEAEDKYGQYGYQMFNGSSFGLWNVNACKFIGVSCPVVNTEELKQSDEFRFCGYQNGMDLIPYLEKYRGDKNVEFFGKLGISPSKYLIDLCKKDKSFRRFLRDHSDECIIYGRQATVYAYKHYIPIEEARRICYERNTVGREISKAIPSVKNTKIDRVKLRDYIRSGRIGEGSYEDYLSSIKFLGMDLADTKNIFPNDFKRMHDLRIDEARSKRAAVDKEKRKEMYKRFLKVSDEYAWCTCEGTDYSIVIPKEPADLVREGEELNHCVGRMGYDVKMADKKSIIFFLRKINAMQVPFVTIEFGLDNLKIRQCYGKSDSKPDDDVMAFANEWASEIAQKIKEQRKEKQNA